MSEADFSGLVITHKPLSTLILKRLLLIFDYLVLIPPEENIHLIPSGVASIDYGVYKVDFTDYLTFFDGPNYKKQDELLLDQFDYARQKGLIRLINLRDRRFYEKYWLPLRLAYEFDTADEVFLRLSMNLIERRTDFIQLDGIIRGMFISPKGMKVYPDIPNVPDIFPPHKEDTFRTDMQCFSAIAKLDRGLAVAGEYNLTPILVSEPLAQIYLGKYEKIKTKQDVQLKDAFLKINGISLDAIQYLLFEISQQIVPDPVLEQIPIRELIIARNNTFQELAKLRRKMHLDIDFLRKNQFDEKFIEESKKYIEKELMPMINLYNNKFIEVLDKFIKYGVTFLAAGIGATIGLSQNMSPAQISLLSGISATVGTFVSNLASYITYKNKDRIKNTYSYFFKFL